MEYRLVDDQEELEAARAAIEAADVIGMDTEFVAEDCYQPDLCLLQVATREEVFIVDPKAVADINCLWDLMVDGQRTVIVHAGREEILFAYRATGKPLANLFDVQVATGLLGGEYPASYGKLLQKFLGEMAPKGETRTDWRKRPLSTAQLDYAAIDVLHLPELLDVLTEQLTATGRLDWLTDELSRRQAALLETQRQEGWYRLSGVQSLHGKQLAIVRELWLWRDQRAQQKNLPPRRVLRDDLIVELARRGVSDIKRIGQIRGLHHPGFQRFLPDIARAVARGAKATQAPETPWSGRNKQPRPPALLKQFLTAAMSYLCRTHNIAPAIVGTSDDVGRLATYWLNESVIAESDDEFPNLLKGWRADLVGRPMHRIFKGEQALRVVDPDNEMPLGLCDVGE